MRVLVAIPVFNESRYVERVVEDVRAHVPNVLVVDDGSTDETPAILDHTAGISVIRHPENRGYGQSLIDAFRWAERRAYDWIITIDCDDQHEPAGIPAFVDRALADDADVISGSRYREVLPGSTDAPVDRRSINRRITKLLNCVLGLSLTDGFCGFKAYRVSAISSLHLTIPGYAFPMQFWTQAAANELRICEISVPLIYNDPTRHFGGILDDPASRYRHYLEVFHSELQRTEGFDGSGTACVEAVLAGDA